SIWRPKKPSSPTTSTSTMKTRRSTDSTWRRSARRPIRRISRAAVRGGAEFVKAFGTSVLLSGWLFLRFDYFCSGIVFFGFVVIFGSIYPGGLGQPEDLRLSGGGEPFGVGRAGRRKRLVAGMGDFVCVSEVHVRRGVQPDAHMVVMMVVEFHEISQPHPCISQGSKPFRIGGCVLRGLEPRFRIGVVV